MKMTLLQLKKVVASTPSIVETLALLSSQLVTLNQRMDSLEGVEKSSTSSSASSVTREASRKQTGSTSVNSEGSKPV